MQQYVNLIQNILQNGEERHDRTGVGTLSIFGGHMSIDLRQRFPLVTLKKTRWQDAFYEMLWFLRGEDNTSFLKLRNVKIWDDWADENGYLGPVYGVQWRSWKQYKIHEFGDNYPRLDDNGKQAIDYIDTFMTEHAIDQIENVIASIKNNPTGRRHIVSAWNPSDIDAMALPPCHRDFQCYVSNDGHLDLMLAQRSWDIGLGCPYNIAQYALLTHLIARATGLRPRHLKINYGDAHLYLNHVKPITEWLTKYQPIECSAQLVFNTDNTDIDGYKIEDFDISGYVSNPFLKLEVAV